MKTPAAEISIDESLIRSLVQQQFPRLSDLPLTYLNEGWDNVMYRLGDEYLIRIPRRQQAVPFIEREQRWLRQLAPHLPLPTPVPLHLGMAQDNYPWPWSIVSWQDGKMAAGQNIVDSEAERLALFLQTLHQFPVPEAPPHNPQRSCTLSAKADGTQQRMDTFLASGLISTDIINHWEKAVELNCPDNQRSLIHGDLHPKNILVQDGSITAIIDWGDFTLGDPATDLAIIWMLFSKKQVRTNALQTYQADQELVGRAIGWAIFFGTILLDIGLGGDELFLEVGQKTLANLSDTDWPIA